MLFTSFFGCVYYKNGCSVKFRHFFKFYRCYGNKNGRQNPHKIEKLPFLTKFKAFRPNFQKLDISTAKYQKILLICCVPCELSSSVKIYFWYLLVLYVNCSVKHCSKMVNFLLSACFDGHFCYHSNGKSHTIIRLIHLGHCPNKSIRIW